MDNSLAWTDERVELLKKLHIEDGLSASLIGARMHVSRNAIIGKIHRLGLVRRHQSPTRRKPNHGGGPRRKLRFQLKSSTRDCYASALAAADRAAREIIQAAPDLVIPPAERRSFAQLEPGDCRWPFSDPGKPDFHFCNRKSVPGAAYCEFHCKRAYNPPAYTGTNIRRIGNARSIRKEGVQTGISTKELAEFDEMARG